jgi:predicted membrane protein
MDCSSCGKELKPGDTFCRQCGAEVGGEAPAPPPPGPTPPLPGSEAKRTSGWSITSLVFGILAWFCIPFVAAILAIVFGVLGKKDVKRGEGKVTGSGMATAGIVLGIVNLAILVIFAAIYIPFAIVNMGELRTETRTVNLEGADTVVAEFDIHDGSLEMAGGTNRLMEGEFTYNVDSWEPDIDYGVSNGTGELSVKQGGGWWTLVFWNAKNEWKIDLNEDVPIDLTVKKSSGSGDLNLSRLSLLNVDIDSSSGSTNADISGDQPSLRKVRIDQSSGSTNLNLKGTYSAAMTLDVDSSSGSVNIDLRGEWQNDMEGMIDSSSGSINIQLPDDVGVYITADVSSGNINASGLRTRGDAYVNDAYGFSGVTIKLNIEASSGNINLKI